MGTIFDLRYVSYSYVGEINALKDISFKVEPGEQISIIGSNGSGKSTLLSILDGLIYPTVGELYAFDNKVVEEVFDTIKDNEFRTYFRTRVGFVFKIQMYNSFHPLSLKRLHLDLYSLICLRKRSRPEYWKFWR
jgi:cobalt/nickel transport system ATP-binding protein